MGNALCLFNPVTCAATSVAKATLGDVFDALTNWVLASVQWLLSAAGAVLNSAGQPAMVVRSANEEFGVLLVLAPPLILLGLLVATMQALRHGDAASLWRTYLGVAPACVAAIFLARPLVLVILNAVDQMSSAAATTVLTREAALGVTLTSLPSNTPGFGLFLLAIAVVIGCALLWCELIVRTVILTLLVVLVPVVFALAVFPALRRVGWRLVETFLAVALSKFFIVIVLVLGLDEVQGSSATQVVTGAVTLLLATFTPFVLLRVIPFIEQSALHNLEGLRHRFTRAAATLPQSPAGMAVAALRPEPTAPGPTPRPADLGLAMWEGDGETEFPPDVDEPPPPPIGVAQPRAGHVAYYRDEDGPVVGWHFDE
jgi:hypothetical protein